MCFEEGAPAEEGLECIYVCVFVSPFAFAEEEVFVSVSGKDVYFFLFPGAGVGAPPAAGLFEEEGKSVFFIFFPEPLEAYFFKDLSHEFRKGGEDAAAGGLSHSVLDEGVVAGDEPVPEAEESVFQKVDGAAGVFFSQRCFSFDDVQIHEVFDVACAGADFEVCFGGDLAEFRISFCYGLNDCIVGGGIPQFLFQEVRRFFEEVGDGVEEVVCQVLFHGLFFVHFREVKGNPAGGSIVEGKVFSGNMGKEAAGFENSKGGKFQLAGAPPEEGAFVAQDLFFHEAHGGAAEDEVDVQVFPFVVDFYLEKGGNTGVGSGEVRVFIYDEDDFFFAGHIRNGFEGCREVPVYRCRAGLSFGFINGLGEVFQIFPGCGFHAGEEDGFLPFAEFPDQGGLPHPPAAVNDYAFIPLAAVPAFQLLQFFFSSDKHGSLLCKLVSYNLLNHNLLICKKQELPDF